MTMVLTSRRDGIPNCSLRDAMLQHEAIFKNQVGELHRLYWTQKSLMRELSMPIYSQAVGIMQTQRQLTLNLQLPAIDETGNAKNLWNGGGSLNPGGVIDLEDSLKLECSSGVVIAEKLSHVDHDEICGEELNPSKCSSGLKESTLSSSIDLSPEKKMPNVRKILHIDLNIDQEDEQFDHFNHSTITFPSPATSSSIAEHGFLWGESKEAITCQHPCSIKQASIVTEELGQERAESSSGQPHSFIISQACIETSSSGFNCSTQPVSVGSTNPLVPAVTLDSDHKRTNCDGSEDDTLSSHAVSLSNDQRAVVLEESLPLVKKSTSIVDFIVAEAAEALVSLSMENLTEAEGGLPEYSSDSFESITLKLPEIRDHGFLILSRPSEVAPGNDACGDKLRRGRGRGRGRVRDFQRDVLPGLVSLSRHEIREDLHAIGYESREKRTRQQQESWPMPVRSRRSRRVFVGQRL